MVSMRSARIIRRRAARTGVSVALLLSVGFMVLEIIRRRSHDHGTARVLQPQAHLQHFPATLPIWASLNTSAWDTQLHRDPSADPLPLLKSFNVSQVTVARKSFRLSSGAFGQFGEDIYAFENFFYQMRGGVFLEMGALDGYTFSNTLMFEHYLGWRGILIEPGPQNYRRLVRNRPNALTLNLAACDAVEQVHFIDQWAVGGVYEFMSPRFRGRWHKDVKVEKLPRIICAPLGFVLERMGVQHIDFFSLDVEGAELHVLRTIDFDKVRFNVITLEARGDDELKDSETRLFLQGKGFKFYGRQAHNFWFFWPDFNPSAQLNRGRTNGTVGKPNQASELRQWGG